MFKKICCIAAASLLSLAASAADLKIVGSSTVFPFASAVAETMRETHPNVKVAIESTGSGGGAKLFCAGEGPETPSITNASRRIKDKEVALCLENGVSNVTEVKIGYDGIALMYFVEAEQIGFTKEQLFQGLNATVVVDGNVVDNPFQKWSDIDPSLPDFDIAVMGPPTSSGTRDSFEELVFDKVAASLGLTVSIREDGAYIESGENDNAIVEKLSSNPQLIGVAGFSFLDQNRDILQAASINGVLPTFEAIAEGEYGISRSMWYYVKNAHLDAYPAIKLYVTEFSDEYAWGEDGYLADLGMIPLLDDERETPVLGFANGKFAQ